MVRSIRFWCLLLGLLEEPGKDSDLAKGALSPGKLGIRLIGQYFPDKNRVDTETGWDPYLEDIASLWLLHWQIFRQPFNAVSWPLAFNFCSLQSFSLQELGASIIDIAGDDARLAAISPRSYEKDAACISFICTHSQQKSAMKYAALSILGEDEVRQIMLQNPFEKFERRRYMKYDLDLAYLRFEYRLWRQIDAEDIEKIRLRCHEAIRGYYHDLV